MTPERIAELRRLADAATEGPWEPCGCRFSIVTAQITPQETMDICDTKINDAISCEQAEANNCFIAAARNALPELLDEVELLRARCERLEKVREAAEAYCTASRALEVATENDWPIKDKIPLGMACGFKVDALRSALAAALEATDGSI